MKKVNKTLPPVKFRYIPSFARPTGRGLRDKKHRLLNEELPKWEISDASQLSEKYEICLEIGYGSGEHLVHRAKERPDTLFIGCEVYLHGIAACLKDIEEENLTNIRLFPEDARLLLETLPQASLDCVYILFPDPWPKNRHHKRRIVNQETLGLLHRAMKPGAMLQLATDHPGYAAWMLAQLMHHGGFAWTAQGRADWENPPPGHTRTRYEEKLKAGHMPVYLNFRRKR